MVYALAHEHSLPLYTFITQRHRGLRAHQIRLYGHKAWSCVTIQCFEWRLQASMAHDHCCVNFCSNDKRNKSAENLSSFNFPSNDLIFTQNTVMLHNPLPYTRPASIWCATQTKMALRDKGVLERIEWLICMCMITIHTFYSWNKYLNTAFSTLAMVW